LRNIGIAAIAIPRDHDLLDIERLPVERRVIPQVGINDPVRGTPARKKDLLVVSHLVSCRNNFATGRTNTARLLEDFGQVATPSVPDIGNSERDSVLNYSLQAP